MFLAWPMMLRDHVLWGSCDFMEFSLSRDLARQRHERVMRFYGWKPLMVSHHPAKFGGQRYYDCGVAECFLLRKRKISDGLASTRHYDLFLKDMDWKQTAYHIINSDPGHTHSNQQLDKNLKITFAIPPKSADENEKGRERERGKKRSQFQSLLRYALTQQRHVAF